MNVYEDAVFVDKPMEHSTLLLCCHDYDRHMLQYFRVQLLSYCLLSLVLTACSDFDWLDFINRADDESVDEGGDEEEEVEESTEPLAEGEFKLLVIGDSLSAPYGTVSASELYHALAQPWLRECGYKLRVANASEPGIKTDQGLGKLQNYLAQHTPQPTHVLIALGSNDGLQFDDIATIRSNLKTLIQTVKAKGIHPLLVSNQLPSEAKQLVRSAYQNLLTYLRQNGGSVSDAKDIYKEYRSYVRDFKAMFNELAEEHQVPLWKNILKDVAGDHKLNQRDQIHPNEEGHEIMAMNFEAFIKQKTNITAVNPVTSSHCQ